MKINIGTLESLKIGSLQVHTGYLTFSLKNLNQVKLDSKPCDFLQKFLLYNDVPCISRLNLQWYHIFNHIPC